MSKNRLDDLGFYRLAMELWDLHWEDTNKMLKDIRGKEIVRQITRSIGSISANIEEGYGRGFSKEYTRFLKISRGSAQESRGWYKRSTFLLSSEVIENRIELINTIIGKITKTIQTIEEKELI